MTRPFSPVDGKVDFSTLEEHLLEHWYKDGIVDKYLHRNEQSTKYFSFLDGPITANNPMGVHHGWGRTYKDVWQRYKNMRGFRERFQNGFDCQGLWVEVEVEKELGVKNKKDIENIVSGDKEASIAKFVDLCRQRVKKYSDIQTDQSKRLGYFMDWDNSYFTLSENNNYAIWHFLKVCHDNGWVYKGNDSVPWCPRCETAISQHEILTEDYKEITHDSVILRLPIVERKNEYLLVWTTTPWTIPANIAVAVDKDQQYALVQKDENNYWVLEAALGRVFPNNPKVIKKQLGKALVGLTYQAPFDGLEAVKAVAKDKLFHQVIATDSRIMPITGEEGTGLVHTAVSAGTEDFQLGKKLDLPIIPVIDDSAAYLDGFDFLSGKNAKTNPSIILDYLKETKVNDLPWAFNVFPYTHRYPGCWRCKAELVWKVTDEWYIAMDQPPTKGNDKRSLRQRMIDVAKQIHWIPGFGFERELDWLTNMHDWLISKKNRYWGLALPIWECENGHFDVLGSRGELQKRAVSGWKEFDGKTPHKPQIDAVRISCSQCNKEMQRIEPVGNPWLDAGIVAYSTISAHNKACLFEGSTEKPLYETDKKQWEQWFPADFITESFPGQFKNWFYSLIAMSTVLEDRPPFKTVLGYASCLAEDGRAMHKSWGNSIEFNEAANKIGVDVMRWMYVRQNPAENLLFGFGVADEVRRRFHLKLWNIYNFYVTYANTDEYNPKLNNVVESKNVLDTWILSRLQQTIVKSTKSLEQYDAFAASGAIEVFVDDLSLWYIRRSRGRVGPAAQDDRDREAFYQTTHRVLTTLCRLLAPFTPFLTDEIYTHLTGEESVHLTDWPEADFKEDKQLEKQMQLARIAAGLIHAQRKQETIAVKVPLLSVTLPQENTITDKEVLAVLLEEVNAKNLVFGKGKECILDNTMTPELEEEVKTRELIRAIQNERKELGLTLSQKINVQTDWQPKDPKNLDSIVKKTQIANISQGPKLVISVSEK